MNLIELWHNLGIFKYLLFMFPAAVMVDIITGEPLSFAEKFGGILSLIVNLSMTLYTFVSYSVGFILWSLKFAFDDFILFLIVVEFFILILASYHNSDENMIMSFVDMQVNLINYLIKLLYWTMERIIDVIRLLKPAG